MGRIGFSLGKGTSPEAWLFGGVGLVFLAQAVILAAHGINIFRPEVFYTNALLYVVCWFCIELVPYLRALSAARPDSPVGFTITYFRGRKALFRRGLPFILACTVFLPAFSAMKSAIPLFTTYSWDPTFIAADRAIFGTDAWRALQPVLGFPIVTSAISVAYQVWILLIYAGCVWFAAYVPDRSLRLRFFTTYFAVWTVCGVVLATLLASVGPCFDGPILGIHTFDPQMAYLEAANRQFPVMVLPVQHFLLDWYRASDHGLGAGISAMPSLHVGLATLFWLAIRRYSKGAGRAFGVFLAVIYVGSVHLAYHYAVDGLVSGSIAVVLWWASGWVWRDRAERDLSEAQPVRAGT